MKKHIENEDLEFYKIPLVYGKWNFARIYFHGVTIIIIVQQSIQSSIQKFPFTTIKYDENKNETAKKEWKSFVGENICFKTQRHRKWLL